MPMAWQSQSSDRPPSAPSNSVAWAALFFSLLAFAMSGFVLFKTYGTGELTAKLKENLQLLKEETSKAITSAKKAGEAKLSGSKEKDKPATDVEKSGGEVRWDKIRERIENLRDMIRNGDDRAAPYLDALKKDLSLLRDYSAEKGSALLDKTMTKLQEVREKLREDTAGALQRLRELSDDLAPKAKSLIGRDRGEKSGGEIRESDESASSKE